ncbi:MAG: restriction endonuclease subunit S [Candidatus Latescibacteria bacterium]|nr:restriction endonuclease subunit S [Candidatus Latescibacterota bacterium]
MNRMQAWSGMFAVPSLDGLISPDYCVFGLVCESEVRYFEHLFKTSLLVGQFAQKSKGIGSGFNRLYTDDFGTIPTMVPPVSEQTYIVRFLNHVDRRIRRYIRAKQKLIVLLEEQKRAIIHQAVTGKIDVRTGKPYPAYKDSGVAWLEEVPEHWKESEKIKYLASLKGRLGWQGLKAGEYTSVGPHIVSSAHFSDHKINWGECPRVTQERYERDQNIQLRRGDILLMKDGAAMGKLAFVDGLPGPACLNSHLLLFRPLDFDEEPTYFPQFMFYYMQSECFQGYVQINGTGATFLGISQESVGNHKICLPPHSEQVAIVKHLDKCIAEIDIVIGGTNRKIEFLGEYQARLIAEVVIGKLDVREAAAELPEDVVPSDHDESEAEYTREHPPM